ncbi:MAG: type I-A CRISPR-associated protein Cas7/Csa2 [Thermocladium sp.]
MISGSLRFLINVESLNGVESVGNLTRHRTAPVVVRASDGGYVVRYVPAISGESIAHAYQMAVADLAKKNGLPVSLKTYQGELIKFSDDDTVKGEGIDPPKSDDDARRFEVDVMLKDVVADIGGFMYAGKYPVRRSSKFMVGYMIPVLSKDEIPAQLEAQFHVRYSVVSSKEKQAIFNVEVGSALYTLSFSLDDEFIGVPSNYGEKVDKEDELVKTKDQRRKVAINALYSIMTGYFGGKRSRFLPSIELKSAVVTVSDFPFIPEPGHSEDYIKLTSERIERAKTILNGNSTSIYAINKEGINVGKATVVNSPEDLISLLSENNE